MHLPDITDHLLQESRGEILEWFHEQIAQHLTQEEIKDLRNTLDSCPDNDLRNELLYVLRKIADNESWFHQAKREWQGEA
jgi:hypothetical protein